MNPVRDYSVKNLQYAHDKTNIFYFLPQPHMLRKRFQNKLFKGRYKYITNQV